MSHPLEERLAAADPEERLAAVHATVDDPSAVFLLDALAGALGDPVHAVAQAAADGLVRLAGTHDVKPALRARLHGEGPRLRLGAALVWARLEPPDLRLLPALVGGLSLPDGKRRWWAAKLLVETGRLHGEVLPVLLDVSRHHADPVARRMAHHCLRELGRGEPLAAATLVAATRDPDVRARRAAYAALASVLDPPDALIARLVDALAHEPDPACRRISTVALAELGARQPGCVGESALAALRTASRDAQDPDLRRGAERALARIEDARAAAPGA